uniref:Uncharacterized protein n=1 Tax=Rhizophora mucronata TaxID=61149 RepID=A0A2P2LGB7_RHIMU
MFLCLSDPWLQFLHRHLLHTGYHSHQTPSSMRKDRSILSRLPLPLSSLHPSPLGFPIPLSVVAEAPPPPHPAIIRRFSGDGTRRSRTW